MFDLKNDRHIDDQSLLFIDEERLDDGYAGILRVGDVDGRPEIEITTGDYSERVLIASAEDAEILVKALEHAIENGWWAILEGE